MATAGGLAGLDADVEVGVGVGVGVVAGVAAKVNTSDGVGRLLSELLALREATFRQSQVEEFCRDSEDISPLEAIAATVVRTPSSVKPSLTFLPAMGSQPRDITNQAIVRPSDS
eukprot:jgi/Tetstr1/429733/TSEL_019626.t1